MLCKHAILENGVFDFTFEAAGFAVRPREVFSSLAETISGQLLLKFCFRDH